MRRILDPKQSDPWWVIVLKIIAYAIGLIIGGIGTMASAQLVGIINEPTNGQTPAIEMRAFKHKTGQPFQRIQCRPTLNNFIPWQKCMDTPAK